MITLSLLWNEHNAFFSSDTLSRGQALGRVSLRVLFHPPTPRRAKTRPFPGRAPSERARSASTRPSPRSARSFSSVEGAAFFEQVVHDLAFLFRVFLQPDGLGIEIHRHFGFPPRTVDACQAECCAGILRIVLQRTVEGSHRVHQAALVV